MTAIRLPILILGLSLALAAQRSPLPADHLEKVRAVLDAIYRLDYPDARLRCQAMIQLWPDDAVGHVYLARVFWQEMLLEQRALSLQRFSQPDFFSETPRYKARIDPVSEQRFRDVNAQAIRLARGALQRRPHDPAALFLLGVAWQNDASFQISIHNAWLAAVRSGNLSHRTHRQLLALDTSYADARLVTGIYNYATASLPWKVKWLALLLGYHGSQTRGREELELAACAGATVSDDARSILTLLYARERRYDLAVDQLEVLRKKYPENYLTYLDLAGLEVRRRRYSAAVDLYGEALQRIGSRSPQSRIYAVLELGKTLDLAGRRREALEQYRLVQAAPDFSRSHEEAARYLERPYQ